MINSMEKQFIQVQLSLFFQSEFTGSFEKASLAVKEEFGEKVIAQIIGLPDDAPAEIPRLMAKSDLVNINLSKNRIDFFAKNESFLKENLEKVSSIMDKLPAQVGRVGVVETFFKEASSAELKELLNENKIRALDPKEITVRLNDVEKVAEVDANNSQMYVTGSVRNDEGIEKKGVVITRDINSLSRDLKKNSFTKETLNSFVSEATVLAGSSLV